MLAKIAVRQLSGGKKYELTCAFHRLLFFFPLPNALLFVVSWLNRGGDFFLLFCLLAFFRNNMKGKHFKSIYQCSSSSQALCVWLLSASQSEGGVLTLLVWRSTVLAYRLQLKQCQWRRLKGLGRGTLDVLFSDVDCLMCSVMSGPHWVWSEADRHFLSMHSEGFQLIRRGNLSVEWNDAKARA